MSATSPAFSLDLSALGELGEGELAELAAAVAAERKMRAIERCEPDALVAQAFARLHTGPTPGLAVLIAPGIVAMASAITETSTGRHTCTQHTVVAADGGAQSWSWNREAASYLHGDTQQVGRVRRGVDLHLAVENLVVVRHSMSKKGVGEPHVRLAANASRIGADQQGDDPQAFSLTPVANFTPGHLPPPEGEEDSRSAPTRRR